MTRTWALHKQSLTRFKRAAEGSVTMTRHNVPVFICHLLSSVSSTQTQSLIGLLSVRLHITQDTGLCVVPLQDQRSLSLKMQTTTH